eukprot:5253112-Prymnesium_polylepis.1
MSTWHMARGTWHAHEHTFTCAHDAARALTSRSTTAAALPAGSSAGGARSRATRGGSSAGT